MFVPSLTVWTLITAYRASVALARDWQNNRVTSAFSPIFLGYPQLSAVDNLEAVGVSRFCAVADSAKNW